MALLLYVILGFIFPDFAYAAELPSITIETMAVPAITGLVFCIVMYLLGKMRLIESATIMIAICLLMACISFDLSPALFASLILFILVVILAPKINDSRRASSIKTHQQQPYNDNRRGYSPRRNTPDKPKPGSKGKLIPRNPNFR